MDSENDWCIVDGELLLGIHRFLASKANYQRLTPVYSACMGLLLAFILVGSFEMIHFSERMQSFLDTVLTKDIETKIEDAVKCVAVVVAFTTSHPRSQSSTKDFVDPCRFSELGIYFSAIIWIQ